MRKYLSLILFIFAITPISLFAAKLSFDKRDESVIIFFTEEDRIGVKAQLCGIVLQMGVKETLDPKEKELGKSVQDHSKISVRLISSDGIIPGSVLYVVNDRNLVVAKVHTVKVFDSTSFYKVCVGYGNFRAVQKDFRVVQRADDERANNAYLYISKGNYYRDQGDISKSIEYFQKAVTIDKRNPEAHSALGFLYLEQKLIPFAIKEFDLANENVGRLYDKEDIYLLLKGSAESRYMAAFYSELPKGNKLRERYVEEGIYFSKRAIAVFPDSTESHFYLGRFYYDRSTDEMSKIETENDENAVKEMEKVISLNTDQFDAYVILARIYKKHNDKDKALQYADKATRINPADSDARELYKSIRKMK
ncbi:MAG TPA: tetratricopeptide repeat protein [Spirochaetota bacterium]